MPPSWVLTAAMFFFPFLSFSIFVLLCSFPPTRTRNSDLEPHSRLSSLLPRHFGLCLHLNHEKTPALSSLVASRRIAPASGLGPSGVASTMNNIIFAHHEHVVQRESSLPAKVSSSLDSAQANSHHFDACVVNLRKVMPKLLCVLPEVKPQGINSSSGG